MDTPPTTEVKPGEEPKTEEAKKDEPVVLTAESIKLPEGATLDAPTMEKFLGVMNDKALDPTARAQALVDMYTEAQKAASEGNSKLWADTQEKWQAEIKNDPAFAGPVLDEKLGKISQLLDNHGSPELRQLMDLTGAGNSIHMVRFLSKIADTLTEPKAVQGTPPSGSRSAANVLFPTLKE